MVELLRVVNEFTPLGIAALALVILLYSISNRKNVNNVRDNHLHEIKELITEVVSSNKRQEDMLQKMNDNIIYIKTKQNGKPQ